MIYQRKDNLLAFEFDKQFWNEGLSRIVIDCTKYRYHEINLRELIIDICVINPDGGEGFVPLKCVSKDELEETERILNLNTTSSPVKDWSKVVTKPKAK